MDAICFCLWLNLAYSDLFVGHDGHKIIVNSGLVFLVVDLLSSKSPEIVRPEDRLKASDSKPFIVGCH